MKLLGATDHNKGEYTDDYPTALEALKDLRILEIRSENGLFDVVEACDKWYGVMMTPAQLRQLGEEIIALSNS